MLHKIAFSGSIAFSPGKKDLSQLILCHQMKVVSFSHQNGTTWYRMARFARNQLLLGVTSQNQSDTAHNIISLLWKLCWRLKDTIHQKILTWSRIPPQPYGRVIGETWIVTGAERILWIRSKHKESMRQLIANEGRLNTCQRYDFRVGKGCCTSSKL